MLACEDDGICGAAAEQTLLDRLHVRRGDLIKLGNATFRVIAVLDSEPDRISTGFSLGPHLLVSAKALARHRPGHAGKPDRITPIASR